MSFGCNISLHSGHVTWTRLSNISICKYYEKSKFRTLSRLAGSFLLCCFTWTKQAWQDWWVQQVSCGKCVDGWRMKQSGHSFNFVFGAGVFIMLSLSDDESPLWSELAVVCCKSFTERLIVCLKNLFNDKSEIQHHFAVSKPDVFGSRCVSGWK